ARGGGKLNARCTEDLVSTITIGNEEFLFFKSFPVHVALLKATTADAKGNLGLEKEPLTLGALSLAIAAKTSGGKVFAQVERIVENGTLPPKQVSVPGVLVDGIVIASDAPQS